LSKPVFATVAVKFSIFVNQNDNCLGEELSLL